VGLSFQESPWPIITAIDLPRQGRTIVVSDYGGKDGKKRLIMKIEFEGDRFRVVEGG
jgi:hypothetical protein